MELSSITTAEIVELDSFIEGERNDVVLDTDVSEKLFISQLAYWESVQIDNSFLYTEQILSEATVNIVRNNVSFESIRALVPFPNDKVPVPNRRCLRYGTHGIHEYRGKFFPQLVKSLINIGNIPSDGVVADPMCGSGTTIVESILAGRRAIGIDMNPLSVLIAQTKCELLKIDPKELVDCYNYIHDYLVAYQGNREERTLPYFDSLPVEDRKYLKMWFSEIVLEDLDIIMRTIATVKHSAVRKLFTICLSNIIRNVSWQKTDDLRVRKEVREDIDIDSIQEFLIGMGKTVRTVSAFLYQNSGKPVGNHEMNLGDARILTESLSQWTGQVDAIITSPPYATALPYLDTDRLSLSYLGLLPRSSYRHRDLQMIGNREITNRIRQANLEEYLEKKSDLPGEVCELIDHLIETNSDDQVGFRRRNLPSLLARYFMDMKMVFNEMHKILKENKFAYVVVGQNHTIANGEKIIIDTPRLLGEIATQVGFQLTGSISMEMLVSRDIFKKNASTREEILCLQKKGC